MELEKIIQTYTNRFEVRPAYFLDPPPADLSLVITIPCYKEPNLLATLESLGRCILPSGAVEVIVAVNAPDSAPEEVLEANRTSIEQVGDWCSRNPSSKLDVKIIQEEGLPDRYAGAGLARKIAMDEGLRRWASLGRDGPILCLDADCLVSTSYLVAAERVFSNKEIKLAHFQFRHDWRLEIDESLQLGIVAYELHLRCFIQGLKWAGYPFAVHTIGSCMAVRASLYARSGGMNKRKAGEDFYFMHKLLPLGGFREIPATVFPSCRVSDRVPFGTGRAQREWKTGDRELKTYSLQIFDRMALLFKEIEDIYERDVHMDSLPDPIREVLSFVSFGDRVGQFRVESRTKEVFFRKFWGWMDGFLVLKLVHYLRDHGSPNQSLLEVGEGLIARSESETIGFDREIIRLLIDLKELLELEG
ncbi:hypothetical protein ADIS_2973 [Lunatimonas lonarensis]|uniref:Glycosyltransferase 2-like domain-containing protein n=1 Tax=Lunatimonas lonarensis TaxID=1232681 RepID=R7ZR37_9BACT|nr:hypothetical protein ADIS_2973 [Lunatimonas lonarensis]